MCWSRLGGWGRERRRYELPRTDYCFCAFRVDETRCGVIGKGPFLLMLRRKSVGARLVSRAPEQAVPSVASRSWVSGRAGRNEVIVGRCITKLSAKLCVECVLCCVVKERLVIVLENFGGFSSEPVFVQTSRDRDSSKDDGPRVYCSGNRWPLGRRLFSTVVFRRRVQCVSAARIEAYQSSTAKHTVFSLANNAVSLPNAKKRPHD
ncbi:unnamed protein product [Hapterophycus canaliculatus]